MQQPNNAPKGTKTEAKRLPSATFRPPLQGEHPDVIHGHVVIDQTRCKGCQLCVGVCPPGVLHVTDKLNAQGYRPVGLFDPDHRCTGCAVCALVCPDVAITVYRQAKATA